MKKKYIQPALSVHAINLRMPLLANSARATSSDGQVELNMSSSSEDASGAFARERIPDAWSEEW